MTENKEKEFWDYLENNAPEKFTTNSYTQQVKDNIAFIKSYDKWHLFKKDGKNPLMYLMEHHPYLAYKLHKNKNAKLIWNDKSDLGESLLNYFLYSMQRRGMYALSYENYKKIDPNFLDNLLKQDLKIDRSFYTAVRFMQYFDGKDTEKYLSFFKQCVDKNGVEFLFNNNDTTFENMVQYEESLLDYRYLPNVINYLDFKMIKIEKIDTIKFFITRLIDEPTLFDKRNEIKKEQDIFLEKIVLTEQQYLLKEMKNNIEIKKKARM